MEAQERLESHDDGIPDGQRSSFRCGPLVAPTTLEGLPTQSGSRGEDDRDIDNEPSGLPKPESQQEDAEVQEPLSPKQASRRTTENRHVLADWWLEAASCFMAVCALIALGVTLYAYRDKPSPNWPTWLSLNTIVAIYSGVLKAGILLATVEGLAQLKWTWFIQQRPLIDLVRYDDAGKGPIGGFNLLWRLRMSYPLASCGAVITILTLAVDPISQQIIRYHDCSVPASGGSARLPRTSFLHYARSGLGTAGVSPNLQRALLSGVFSPANQVNFHCSTGNCTWHPEFSTLGWCSECEDISNLLSIRNVTGNGTDNVTLLQTVIPDGGLSITTPYSESKSRTYAAMDHSPWPLLIRSNLVSLDFMIAQQPWGFIADATTSQKRPECQNSANNANWKCKGYGAARCQLFPCVKTYNAYVVSGKLTETLLNATAAWQPSRRTWSLELLDDHCVNLSKDRKLQSSDLHGDLADHTSSQAQNASRHDSIPPAIRRNCTYHCDRSSLDNLWAYFAHVPSSSSPLTSPFEGAVHGADQISRAYGVFWGSPVVGTFFNQGDVEFERVKELFQNISEAMTSYTRQNGRDGYSEPAQGVAKEHKTCISVVWPWLAFSTSLTILTIAFLLLTTIETLPRDDRPLVWKSSPLVLFYHSLVGGATSHSETRRGDPPDSLRAMEESAKSTFIRLGRSHLAKDSTLHYKRRHRKMLGSRGVTFWLSLAVVIIFILAAVIVGLGATLWHTQYSNERIDIGPPTSSSSSDRNADAQLPITRTGFELLHCNNHSIYEATSGARFKTFCSIDWAGGDEAVDGGTVIDLQISLSATFQGCMDQCADYNQAFPDLERNQRCNAAAFHADIQDSRALYGGNCWFKSAPGKRDTEASDEKLPVRMAVAELLD